MRPFCVGFFSVISVQVVVLDTCGVSVAMPVAAPFPADLPTGFVVPWRRNEGTDANHPTLHVPPRLSAAQPVVGQGTTMESAGLQAQSECMELSLFFSMFFHFETFSHFPFGFTVGVLNAI